MAKGPLREYLTNNPEATTKELVAMGYSKSQIYSTRNTLGIHIGKKTKHKKEPAPVDAEPVSTFNPYSLKLEVPSNGLEIKLEDGRNMLGTFQITHEGIKFIKANGKVVPERMINWRILTNLMEIGLL